jgi:hypothetical protein
MFQKNPNRYNIATLADFTAAPDPLSARRSLSCIPAIIPAHNPPATTNPESTATATSEAISVFRESFLRSNVAIETLAKRVSSLESKRERALILPTF